MAPAERKPFSLRALLTARCPACHTGKVLSGVFAIRPRCSKCDYDLHPEPGFYLGAMVVGFLLSAVLMIPPLIILKVMEVDMMVLVVFPFVELLFVGTFILFYCRILWLHLEYQMTQRLKER